MLTREEILEHINKGECLCIKPSFGDDWYKCSLEDMMNVCKVDDKFISLIQAYKFEKVENETYEASVHGIINNWTDREWELFKTIKPFDLEEKMIVYFDKWLHDDIDDRDRHRMDLREN